MTRSNLRQKQQIGGIIITVGAILLVINDVHVALPGIMLGVGLMVRDVIKNHLPKRTFTVFLSFLTALLLFELGAILDPYGINEFGEPVRLYEDGGKDLFLSLFFHIPWAIGWTLLVTVFAYRAREVYIISGIIGVFLEQSGVVLAQFFSGDISSAIGSALLIFFLYGVPSAAGFTWILPKGKIASRWRILLPFVLIPTLIAIVFGSLLLLSGSFV